MYREPFNPWRGQGIIAVLAIVGLIWCMFSLLRPSSSQVSLWSGPRNASQPKAAQQGASSGITGNTVPQTAPQTGRGLLDALVPTGNPLHDAHAVMTQGYGVGSHAPAEMWGAIDLAIDGNGDGSADPQGTLGKPIYATNSGVVKLSPNSVPAGNHVWVINDQYKTGYSHLQGFAVEDGAQIDAGTLIGYVGSTGQSSGPHLDYQIWKMVDGAWVNQNPLNYHGADK